MRFLLVEDNEELGEAVRARFVLDGHAIDWAKTIGDAEAYFASVAYDLILLDIMLPDGDGREFLRQRRSEENRTPVLVLTARSQVSDRVRVLDLGADDYVTKPFDFDELDARCRAVLRRVRGEARNFVTFGKLVFDPLSSSVQIGDETITLRNREMRILEVLLSEPGRTFSKTHLMDRIFALEHDVSDNAIEVYVGRLRKKIAASNARIDTVRGIGYRIVAS